MMMPGQMQQPMMMPGQMQQPMMMPGQMQMPQVPVVDGWTILSQMPSGQVQEKIRWGEVLTQLIGIEVDFANKYVVLDPAGNEVFLFAEQTDFCKRQMKRGCCAECVGWDVDVLTIFGGQNTPFLKMHRENTFTVCCFNRPVTQLTEVASGNLIGSIRDPWAVCNLTFDLMGPDGADVLKGNGGCCQWGLCCQLPFGPCATVEFDIEDCKTKQSVGHITKKVPSCLKFLVDSGVDNYEVDLNGVENPQWKAMLFALSVFIDFRYFSVTQDPSRVGQDGLIGMAGGGFGGDGF